ncbi:MAG: 50S ribosomal protein L20 [Tenericutes bacterium GWC2_34_14]|nr:MAG: 50S ribosomal protein L20 [Tenericutes bacterium GWA2_35_7]OHE29480.1 MAG: 50S ribosomal protein L20 [Tenericutes bacterium GWC2_34_14]OHE34576.1 MAG: 50S ribosomal protein L20 [Tenericutes bacterium GWE2_34_108]OHE35933.1 MAG: 50S ribosomal protein L20 [Tenericutes bacterium GWF1_35_14]OHE38981.1 MAG: 50S ribosomal protein L20 [Tenericutes bacterium GWF2_35_184]OHE41812.1 MAG: 50S ribosomal protein L20 [Tenericutes bacterium RIFOXYA12_FULL_35_10]OHE42952.1 MAG: 50S ribosomal protein 
MPRVKGGYTARRRRKKILKLAKGYFGSKSTIYRTAHEQVMRSLSYAYRDRKQKKRQFRKLWIQRINAAAKLNNMKYSILIHGLALANVEVNRKVLADLAVNDAQGFTAYCNLAKDAINGNLPKKVEVKAAKPAKVEKVEVVETVDYSKMLVKDLKALANEKGIEGADKMLKADLVDALNNAK